MAWTSPSSPCRTRSSRRSSLQSDQLDTYSTTDVAQSNALQQGHNYTVVKDPVNTFIAFTMNVTRKPWDDDRIRKAASAAINRQEYIDRVYQGEAKANGLVHWPQGDLCLSDDELKKYQPYDPAMSKQLINAATGSDSVDVTIMYPADSDIEQHKLHKPIFVEQMKAGGFNVKEDPQAFAVWLDNYTKLEYDASLALNQVYEYAEFNLDFQHSEGPARNKIYAVGVGKLYPEIDAEIDRVKTLTNHADFVKGMHDLQVMIYDKGASFLPLVSPYSFTLYQPRVKAIPEGIGASGLYVNDWYLES
jgi:ABC-type transport system substrate-binding protein